jgi:hypothetical protein
MICTSFLVAGVGIGYGLHSGNAAVLVIAIWLLLATCVLAFMAGVTRLNKVIDCAVSAQLAERRANEVKRPAHEVARRNIDNGVVLAWPSGLGDRRYPQEEDVDE